MAAACVLLVAATGAQVPSDKARADELARRATARIRALQREADSLAAHERTLLDQLRRLEVQRDLRAEQYAQGERDLAGIQHDLGAIVTRIDQFEARAAAQAAVLSSRMVELYKLGKAGYARLLLSVDDLREAGRAYRFVSALQQLDRQRVAEHDRTLADLRRDRASLEDRRRQLLMVQEQVSASKAAAAGAATAQAALIRQIDQRRDLAAQLMGELQVAQQKLQQQVAGFEQGGRAGEAAGPLALPLRPFRGDLDWPLDGRVLAPFGQQFAQPRPGTTGISNGIRIGAAPGAPVHVIHEGTVVFAEPFTGFGNLVIVDHGGQAWTMYGTLSTMTVSAGTRVIRGQSVGSAGTSPDGVASIYFELRVDGKAVDPLQWLRKK
ncbi:MAG: peptidoglycan DD-metalloendopeptidase family protein [Acidobacteria bacterium]|nr:peptidoglycan DD-metalloendopeptidase family protein [Acidobacteriota bacterium]